jgi:hypothetical protein
VDPLEELHLRTSQQVMEWAIRLARHGSTDEVKGDMVDWVARSDDRLWALTVSSVGCLRDMTQCAVSVGTGGLVVPEKGSWFIEAMKGRDAREPDVVAAVQSAIAMLNQDHEMVHDILVAHGRVGGPQALFGVARVATSMVAAMLEVAALDEGDPDVQ